MAGQIKRIEFYDPKTNAVILAITNPDWVSFLMTNSDLFRSYAEELSANTTVFRWPINDIDPKHIKILGYMIHGVKPTLPTNETGRVFPNRNNEYTFGNNIFTRREMASVLKWLLIPHNKGGDFLDMYLENPAGKPNTEESIHRMLKHRRELFYEYEPGLNGKTANERRYNEQMAQYEAERKRILNRLREAQRKPRQKTRRHRRGRGYNNNYEFENEENYLNRQLNELNDQLPNLPQPLEEAYAEMNFPPETLHMTNVEFERWLREHPATKEMRAKQYATITSNVPNYNLHKLFNKNGRRSRKSRRRTTR